MDIVSDAIRVANEEFAQFLESPIWYARDSQTEAGTLQISAMILPAKRPDYSILGMQPGTFDATQLDAENQPRDFSIHVSRLRQLDPPAPVNGDEIQVMIGDTEQVFEVATPQTGSHCYEVTDAGTRFRVHARFLRFAYGDA